MKATVINPNQFQSPDVFIFPTELFPESIGNCIDDNLDFIFRQCYHATGKELIEGKRLRSMSVGDMVEIEVDPDTRILYVCMSVGWKEIEYLIKNY